MKLLNLFKKQEQTKVLVIEDNERISTTVLLSSNSYPKEVQMIHHEFHTAADNLLLEANSIIEEARTKNVTKVHRLELLGFKQASQVTELKLLQQKAELSKEQLESLAYYQREYPFNKFITEEQVKTICHKYNLVCGDVSRFKGFVPEKNLSDIEKFSLKDNEKSNLFCKSLSREIPDFILENAEIYNEKDYYFIVKFGEKRDFVLKNYAFQSNDGNYFYASDMYNIFNLKSKGDIRFEITNNNLQICAPVKDMDISGLELKEGYKLTKKHISDPVVLQPVKNGYLIITAWGDEASDPLVVNQINN